MMDGAGPAPVSSEESQAREMQVPGGSRALWKIVGRHVAAATWRYGLVIQGS